MSGDEKRLREEIVATARRMNATGLNQGTSGNVSARSAGGFLITPSGLAYGDMAGDQIVAMDLAGGHAGPLKPSSEWRMHRDIYKANEAAGAVIHVHSPYATALSTLRIEVPAFHYMVALAGGSSLRCADYATFGTEALSEAMLAALDGRRACLLANHGMICHEANLARALRLAVEVEALCRQYAIARCLGDPVILDDAEMDRVLARFASYGQQDRKD